MTEPLPSSLRSFVASSRISHYPPGVPSSVEFCVRVSRLSCSALFLACNGLWCLFGALHADAGGSHVGGRVLFLALAPLSAAPANHTSTALASRWPASLPPCDHPRGTSRAWPPPSSSLGLHQSRAPFRARRRRRALARATRRITRRAEGSSIRGRASRCARDPLRCRPPVRPSLNLHLGILNCVPRSALARALLPSQDPGRGPTTLWNAYKSWESHPVPSLDLLPQRREPDFAPPAALSSDAERSAWSDDLKATWLGHACFLVEFPAPAAGDPHAEGGGGKGGERRRGFRVLFDPVWSHRCSPLSFAGPQRVTKPPIALDELPHVDAVVISHNHCAPPPLPHLSPGESP